MFWFPQLIQNKNNIILEDGKKIKLDPHEG